MDVHYKIPKVKVENGLNVFLSFLHRYRLVWVLLAIVGACFLTYYVWNQSSEADKLKNSAVSVTCASIILGIFYSLINYEYSQFKFRHDVKTSRELLTYNTACKMYDENMLGHFKTAITFYEANKSVFVVGDCPKIEELFSKDPKSRQSFVLIFNYLEIISIGINQGIIDETFTKQFFNSIFSNNYGRFGTYIGNLTVSNGSAFYENFLQVAIKWKAKN